MFGSLTKALPKDTRCISPPDNCVALLLSLFSIFNNLAISRTLSSIVFLSDFLRGERRGKARLSYTE